jgi:Sulfotransferase domain
MAAAESTSRRDSPAEGDPTRDGGRAPKVLYIGGTGRTGSTILEKLLGQIEGVFSAGELTFLWSHSLGLGGRCSCGSPLTSCDVWSSVLTSAFDGDQPDHRRMVTLRRRFWSGHLPLMVVPGEGRRGLRRLAELPQVIERVYRALAAVTGARLIVDTSKEPHYSYILREATNLDVYFLHLVRDPRAVGYSWRQRRIDPGLDGDVARERRGPLRTSLYYAVSNTAAEALWSRDPHYRLLRYEDFVGRPAETLQAIGDLCGEDFASAGVLDGKRFTVRSFHSAWGNPNRFEHGTVELRPDERWRSAISVLDRSILTTLLWPFVVHYGYRQGKPPSRRFAPTRQPLLPQ